MNWLTAKCYLSAYKELWQRIIDDFPEEKNFMEKCTLKVVWNEGETELNCLLSGLPDITFLEDNFAKEKLNDLLKPIGGKTDYFHDASPIISIERIQLCIKCEFFKKCDEFWEKYDIEGKNKWQYCKELMRVEQHQLLRICHLYRKIKKEEVLLNSLELKSFMVEVRFPGVDINLIKKIQSHRLIEPLDYETGIRVILKDLTKLEINQYTQIPSVDNFQYLLKEEQKNEKNKFCSLARIPFA